MRWRLRWWRARRRPDLAGSAHAEAVAEEAARQLDQVRGQRAEVERLAESLRVSRERNHFAELFEQALRGRR